MAKSPSKAELAKAAETFKDRQAKSQADDATRERDKAERDIKDGYFRGHPAGDGHGTGE